MYTQHHTITSPLLDSSSSQHHHETTKTERHTLKTKDKKTRQRHRSASTLLPLLQTPLALSSFIPSFLSNWLYKQLSDPNHTTPHYTPLHSQPLELLRTTCILEMFSSQPCFILWKGTQDIDVQNQSQHHGRSCHNTPDFQTKA